MSAPTRISTRPFARRCSVTGASRSFFVLALILGLAACQDAFRPGFPLLGTWGGPHLRLDLNASGGVLDYDCATGAIHEPLIPDDEGHMIAVGTHSPGHGGPGMEGEVIPQLPARYEGIVRNDHLLLTVTLIDSAKVVGTFDLRYGRAGTVNKCL